MGSLSLTHWLVVLAIVLLLFGAGRIPHAMSDLARGIRALRSGMRNDNSEADGEKLVEASSVTSGRVEARSSAEHACSVNAGPVGHAM